MDKNKKLIGIAIIIIGVIMLAAVIYFMFFFAPAPEEPSKNAQEPENTAQPVAKLPEDTSKKTTVNIGNRPQADKVTEEDLKQMAMSFAERLGSYSNQSNYGNIKDLKIFMSSKMKVWADNYIKEEMAKKNDYSIYYGMTTKAASAEVKHFDDGAGEAEISVSTQRRMATGTMDNAVSYQQDVLINFVKERGAWKVDSAEWE